MNNKSLYRSIVLALGLTFVTSYSGSIISAEKTSADFTDLKDLDAATKAKIDAMISAGIFDGVSDTTFGLKEEMNRAQFAKVAALVTGLKIDESVTTSSFSDVQIDSANGYALPYIEALKTAGITEGYGDGTYNPAGKVTKEQLATFLVRIVGKEADVKSGTIVSDQTVSDWAKGYVDLALELKLLNKAPDGTFGGNVPANRELLTIGAFKSAKVLEESQPLLVTEGLFETVDKLKLTLTVRIDPQSIDLSKFKLNGVPLDPKLDSFVLSEDGKTIIIKLHKVLQFDDQTKMPKIDISDLKTLYGNSVKNEERNPILVTTSESLVTKPKSTIPSTSKPPTNPSPESTPSPSPEPTPSPSPESTPSPSPEPTPSLSPEPTPSPSPEPTPSPSPEPTPSPSPEPTPSQNPNPNPTNPNPND